MTLTLVLKKGFYPKKYILNQKKKLLLCLGAHIHTYENQDLTRFTCLEKVFYFEKKKNVGGDLSKSSEMVVKMRKGSLTRIPVG